MDVINEGSAQTIRVSFFSDIAQLIPATPVSATYSVRCKTTNTPIKTDIALIAATTIDVMLDSVDSAILSQANNYEDKILTVKSTYTSSDKCNAEYTWRVKNLSGV